MNLWQRARTRSQRFAPQGDYESNVLDRISSMMRLSGRPVNGQFEITQGDLDSISERIYKSNGPVFSLIAVRMLLFGQARYAFQRMRDGRPGDLFTNRDLTILEHPDGPASTCNKLAMRAEQDISLVGNAFLTSRMPGRIRRLRPDWVTIVYGSNEDPELYGDAIDGEVIAYLYTPRLPGGTYGAAAGAGGTILFPDEVAHYAPYPDPQANHRGMSWLTPVIREIGADEAALTHKESFFRNSASPRLAMKIDPSIEEADFLRLAEMIDAQHSGPFNAWKTLYLGGGADPIPLTMSLKDLDYKAVTGAGETRLASAAGVPPTFVGFSEGLSGSSLNAGNYQQSKRRLGDGTLRPLWGDFAGSLEAIIPTPSDARLWYDDRDIAFLRDDEKDASAITQQRASTVLSLVNAGYTPKSAAAAAQTGDLSVLEHTGLYSVQLQPPTDGSMGPDGKPAVKPATSPAAEVDTTKPATPENGHGE